MYLVRCGEQAVEEEKQDLVHAVPCNYEQLQSLFCKALELVCYDFESVPLKLYVKENYRTPKWIMV